MCHTLKQAPGHGAHERTLSTASPRDAHVRTAVRQDFPRAMARPEALGEAARKPSPCARRGSGSAAAAVGSSRGASQRACSW